MSPDTQPDSDTTRTHTDSEPIFPAGTVLAGRYRIAELVGVGGMGMVYRARDEQLDLDVALKVLRPDRAAEQQMLERFRQELILARQVSHKHVVRIHDIGRDGDVYFLTMDFVSGRSLKRILEEEGQLEPERAAEIAGQMAQALAAAHAQDVIHRDLKPANVLVDEQDAAYITDFGVARSMTTTGLTRTGSVVGTPDYLSPEQARGEKVDHRTDIYALGLLLFEMLTGQSPFTGGTFSEVLAQRISGRPRTLAEAGVKAPLYLQAILDRCLDKNPQRRYQDASEMAADLAERRGRRRLPGWWRRAAAALGVVLAVALVAAVARWWPAREVEPELAPSAVASAKHAVAVLPLIDETGREDLSWISTGVAEMLSDSLAESPALRVVDSLRLLSTLEDLQLAPSTLVEGDLRQLAELLDVDRLITGRVRSAGDRLRIDARLVLADLPDLPTRPFGAAVGAPAEIFELIDQLGSQLRRELEVPEIQDAPQRTMSSSPAALRAYTQGVEELLRGNSVAAAPSLERAVAEDPSFTAAWIRLADAHERLGYQDKALDAIRRAVEQVGSHGGRLSFEARAKAAALEGEMKRAQTILSELATRYPHDIEARVILAEAYGDEGRFDEAREVLTQVVEEDSNHPRAWYLLGKFSILAGDVRQAIDEYLVRALVIQNRLGNEQGKGDVENALGLAHYNAGELDQALFHFERAADIRRAIGDERGIAATLTNIGLVQSMRGDHQSARASFSEALEIRQTIGDHAGVANVYNYFGILEEEQGRYREALEHFRRALQMRRDLGDRRALAESHNNVGFAYYVLGEYDNAAVYWQQALDLYRESGNREGVVYTTQSVGQLELARGNWEAALKSFLAALEESRQIGLRQAEPVSLGNIGRVAQYQGRYGAALNSYQEALDILDTLQHLRGLAEITLFEASALIELGLLDAAEERMERAQEWLTEGGNREQEAEFARLQGEMALRRGEPRAARSAFLRAAKKADASGGRVPRLEAQLGLGAALLAADQPDQALKQLRPVAEEARLLGHTPLELASAVTLGEAELAAGDSRSAEATARRGLRLAESHGPYAGTYRLHLLLARALKARGAVQEASRQLGEASRHLDRVRKNLTDVTRDSFNALPEVTRVVQETRTAALDGGNDG